jgi:transposase
MQKIYHVDLTPKQRKDLKKLVRYGRTKAQVITNAHILLKADEDKTDEEIASLQYVGIETVRRVRQRYWKQGLDHALNGNPYPPREPKLSDEQEAYLIALACSDAPKGYARWTLEMLAERMVADGKIDTISPSKVQMTLKKTNSSRGDSNVGALQS